MNALYAVLRVSGSSGKALLAMDLMMEFTMVLVTKGIFFMAMYVFVGARLKGSCFVRAFCRVLRLTARDLNRALWEVENLPFERD